MRFLAVLSLTLIVLASACGDGAEEHSMECHGVNRGNHCVQFPNNARVAKIVATMPVLRQDAPLTRVTCYSKGTLAVCDGTLKHGSLGVTNAHFRIHPDGSVTPVCPAKAQKQAINVFCTSSSALGAAIIP